jgi:hypothetical protein
LSGGKAVRQARVADLSICSFQKDSPHEVFELRRVILRLQESQKLTLALVNFRGGVPRNMLVADPQ